MLYADFYSGRDGLFHLPRTVKEITISLDDATLLTLKRSAALAAELLELRQISDLSALPFLYMIEKPVGQHLRDSGDGRTYGITNSGPGANAELRSLELNIEIKTTQLNLVKKAFNALGENWIALNKEQPHIEKISLSEEDLTISPDFIKAHGLKPYPALDHPHSNIFIQMLWQLTPEAERSVSPT